MGQDPIKKDEVQDLYKNAVEGELRFVEKLSQQCKFIWAGSLAFYMGALWSDPNTIARSFYELEKDLLIGSALAGGLGLILDYVQTLFGYFSKHRHVRYLEGPAGQNASRNEINEHLKSKYRSINEVTFWAKNIVSIFAAVLIFLTIMHFAIFG